MTVRLAWLLMSFVAIAKSGVDVVFKALNKKFVCPCGRLGPEGS